jgi:Domain of unknown function (DUF4419)
MREGIEFREPTDDWRKPEGVLVLDGVSYHSIDTKNIPPAQAEVEVTLNDNGQIFKSALFAGLVGTVVGDSGIAMNGKDGTCDQLSPAVGWSFFTIKAVRTRKTEEEEIQEMMEKFARTDGLPLGQGSVSTSEA